MSNSSFNRIVRWCLLGVSLCALGVLVGQEGGLVDDAYIFCRYADNIAGGYGAVFNPGQRVEGFTSPLFTYLTALGVFVGAFTPSMVALLSFCFGAFVLVGLALYKGAPGDSDLTHPLAAVLTISTVPFGLWASTGMDVTLFAMAVVVATLFMERQLFSRCDGPLPFSPWLWFGVGCIVWVRPEALILLALMFVWSFRSFLKHRRSLAPWISMLAGGLPMAALTVFRRLYFDSWLPNTYYAKMSGGGGELWHKGLVYLFDAAILLLPLLLGVVLFVLGSKKKKMQLGIVLSVIFGLAIGIVAEGGDFFPMYRFVVPLIPLLAVVSVRAIERAFVSPRIRIAMVLLLCVVNSAWTFVSPSHSHPEMMSNLEGFRSEVAYTRLFSVVGQSLKKELGSDHRIGILTIGAIPYQTGYETVDMLGLTDKWIARQSAKLGAGVVGHEKFDTEYFLDRKPDLVLLHPWIWKNPVESKVVTASPYLHGAQKALIRSKRFQQEYRLQWIPSDSGYIAIFSWDKSKESETKL